MDTVIERTILYRMKYNESFEEIYPDFLAYILEKYGENGYLKVFLETKYTTKMLSDIRELLKDKTKFKIYVYDIYEKLVK